LKLFFQEIIECEVLKPYIYTVNSCYSSTCYNSKFG